MVLVHGAPDRRGAFRRVQRQLAEFRTITYDRRGYGESAWMTPAKSLDDHARDLLDVLDGRRAIAAGHSFGANVALLASTMAPEHFVALALWEPSMCWLPGWDREHREQVRRMATVGDTEALGEQMGLLFVGRDRWPELDEPARRLWRREGLAVSLDMSFILEPPYDLERVSVPSVVGIGSATSGPHYTGGHLLAAGLGIEPVVIEGVTHLAHLQSPAAWADFVRGANDLVDP